MPSFGGTSGICRPLVVVISLAICAVLLTRCLKSGVVSATGCLGFDREDSVEGTLSGGGIVVLPDSLD